jgi:hypothetical protein
LPLSFRIVVGLFVVSVAMTGGGGCISSSSSSSSTGVNAPIAQGACPQDSVCFNIFTAMPGPVGPSRFVLLWVQPEAKGDQGPADLVELAALTGHERAIMIKRSNIRPPARIGAYGVTWGYAYTIPQNGPPGSTSPKSATGIAQMMFTDAKAEIVSHFPPNATYPAGFIPGVGTYRMNNQGSGHDKFFQAGPGNVFDLVVCPLTVPNCQLPSPNPS